MWNIQNNQTSTTKKITVNFSIDKHLYEQFKRVAKKTCVNTQISLKAVFVDMCRVRFKYLCDVVIINHV